MCVCVCMCVRIFQHYNVHSIMHKNVCIIKFCLLKAILTYVSVKTYPSIIIQRNHWI